MASTNFTPDRGLTIRMILVMLLLAVVYAALMGYLAWSMQAWWIAIVAAPATMAAHWYFSDRMALSGMRAREVSPAEEPELHAMVDRLCALADMPKPKVAMSASDMPNAFAAGRSPERAVVCVTSGIRSRLEDDELEAVLAHELSHVAHRDVMVMTVASAVAVLAGFLMRFPQWLARQTDSRRNWLLVVVTLPVYGTFYAISFLLTRMLSRYRELAADRGAAMLTGQPSALASALTKLSDGISQIPQRDLRTTTAYNAFYVVPAIMSKISPFHTHPPLERRLARLEKISVELGQS